MDKHSKFDAWKVFRIVSEFVDGFETMSNIGPAVCVFGSSRTNSSDPYYQKGVDLGKALAQKNFGIITGGGGGAMEAANKGAQEGGGISCGVCIDLPTEDQPNPYIDRQYHLHMRYFFIRKVLFVRYTIGFVFMPGGYGTLDELFEVLTLIQTFKIQKIPLFLFGTEFWGGLIEWLKKTPVKEQKINLSELELFKVTDNINDIVKGIESYHQKTHQKATFDLDQTSKS